MENLKDKTVFITGASSGIGAACALLFAKQGAHLILAARRTEKLNQVSKQCLSYGLTEKQIHTLSLDVSNSAEVKKQIHAQLKKTPQVDILINNAGIALGLEKLTTGTTEDWDAMIDTNVKGLLYVTHALLPTFLKQNSGHIINMGSIAGYETYPSGAVYCATKAAVRALNTGLLMDLVDTPIRVSSIDPGMVETEFSIVRFKGDTARASKVYENFKALTAHDIAQAVLFVASCPPHMNIREMIVLPTHQASAQVLHRKGK